MCSNYIFYIYIYETPSISYTEKNHKFSVFHLIKEKYTAQYVTLSRQYSRCEISFQQRKRHLPSA